MKSIYLLLVPLLIFAGFKQNPKVTVGKATAATEKITDSLHPVRDGLFIHISSGYDNPHKALMPLKMAVMMADVKDVAVYMDIEAVKMVLKDSKDMAYDNFPNLKDLLAQLVAKKVLIMACPTCLRVAGKGENDLIKGVILSDKEKFFSFTKGKITSLDY
ncbi:MAG: DsrE family protein [Syntrophothermus sp.]